MSLTSGTRLGPYEIVSPLGAGGMGEVYRARDTRLGRDVAIKALPADFAQDPDRLVRFEREARLLASLSHPNIAGIYGIEDAGGVRYLVLEFVEGETLAARLARGPVPIDDALQICAQVATAIEAAHEAGIIHRDLKPGNVMLRPDGTVKVLDFGLAKSGGATASASDLNLSASPTVTYAGTSAGVVLGTAAYMSPEQARGRNVDRRTDIWSFGCVLYECLSGRPLFEGDTVSDLIAKILQTEPDWTALPAPTPPRVRSLLVRCLTKDAKQRLRDIGEARIVLADTTPEIADAPAALRGHAVRGGSRWPMAAALAIVAALVGGLAVRILSHAPVEPGVMLSVMLPKGARLDGGSENDLLAIAPDGARIVFAASIGTEAHRLFVRGLAEPGLAELAGTDGAAAPFFSPDGEWVAFFANRHLLKTSIQGGTPVELADAGSCRGGTWLDSGSIVYTPTFASPLLLIDANGGTPRAITTLDSTRNERTHRWPCGLPGSKWVVFTVGVTNSPGGYDDATIEAVSLHSGERRVLAHGSRARYASGHLVFARNGSLYAMPIDPTEPRAAPTAVPVLDGVLGAKTSGIAFFDIARNGTLVTVPGKEGSTDARLVWKDFTGHGTVVPGEPRSYQFFDISPDGKSALTQLGGGGNGDIFLLDLKRGTVNQLTFTGHDGTPLWTPDGRHMVWARSRGASNEVVTRSVLGGDSVRILTTAPFPLLCTGVRHDGSAVLISEYGPVDSDISEVPLAGGPARVLVREPRSQSRGVMSPDDRWIAYVTDESGAREVCVRPVGGTGGRTQISTNGGTTSMWAPDGRTLYFTSGNGLAEVALAFRGSTVVADSTRYLFDLPFVSSDASVQSIGLDPSGKRFLVRTPLGEINEMREITVRTHWASSLDAPAGKGER